jgi:predicted AAA+ superfamily ATPase
MNGLRWCRSLSQLCVVARLIAGSHVHGIGVRGINRAGKTSMLLLLLGHNLPCVEFYEHCPI